MTINTFGPINSQTAFLPVEFQIPKEEKDVGELISKRERLTASVINVREIGIYDQQETITAQQWFSTQTQTGGNVRKERYTYRRVFDLVALNAGANIGAGTSTFKHNISQLVIPTRIFGSATAIGPFYLPLPYASVTGNDIEIWFEPTIIGIVNNYGANLMQCYITIEFLKSPT